jgi:hypothetical protein
VTLRTERKSGDEETQRHRGAEIILCVSVSLCLLVPAFLCVLLTLRDLQQ